MTIGAVSIAYFIARPYSTWW